MGSGWPNCDLLLVINLAKRPAGPRINLTQEITMTVSQSWFEVSQILPEESRRGKICTKHDHRKVGQWIKCWILKSETMRSMAKGLGMKNYSYALWLISIDNICMRMPYQWHIIECTDKHVCLMRALRLPLLEVEAFFLSHFPVSLFLISLRFKTKVEKHEQLGSCKQTLIHVGT